jgi:twinfilin-like protein
MHTSGIAVTTEMTAAFAAAEGDSSIGFVSVGITRESSFEIVGQGATTGSFDGDLKAVAATLQPKVPVYVLVRFETKWLLIFYCPDNSPVRSKMLFASSLSSLKEGLGGSKFTKWDFPIDSADECNIVEYERTTSDAGDSVMTYEEKHAFDASKHAPSFSENEVSAIVNVPINVDDEALNSMKGFAGGSHTTCVFLLNKAEQLELAEAGNDSLDVVASKLPDNEPRFILHAFTHDRQGADVTSNVFIYYCPGKAHPKLRMFYSTVKANVIQVFEALGVAKAKNMECSETKEISDEIALKELYPDKVEKKTFAKPKAVRGNASKRAPKASFNPNA